MRFKMGQIILFLFFFIVGIAAVVVTFPWGLAIFLALLIVNFGFQNVAEEVGEIFYFLLKIILIIAIIFGVIILLGS